MTLSIRDIKILSLLNSQEINTEYNAKPFEQIGELYQLNSNSTISESTLRRSLKTLISGGYVGNGYKRGNIKTYYITILGIKLLSEIK